MLLQTDDQTLDDLGIFGRRGGAGIYDLYNRTHTRGGQAVLEEMFRHPLSDKAAISKRTGIIATFARLNLAFPFQGALFDTAEKYLMNPDERTINSASTGTLN